MDLMEREVSYRGFNLEPHLLICRMYMEVYHIEVGERINGIYRVGMRGYKMILHSILSLIIHDQIFRIFVGKKIYYVGIQMEMSPSLEKE